ncbi:gamma-glutamyl-gamma-aminobutyrate hydrolase family protein [Porticoccus sp.]
MRHAQWPVVGIPCDVYMQGKHPQHGCGEKYINALAHGAGVRPVLLPAVAEGKDLAPLTDICSPDEVLDGLDGLFLTGNVSNVDPQLYGEQSPPGNLLDPQRDATTLPLILRAIERDIPLFAVCRGFQELNVALGGTLYQRVHEVPGMLDHREDSSLPREGQYDYAHEITLVEGGLLRKLAGVDHVMVNSVHGQGIRQLAEGLAVEATAPDGLIEAVRLIDPSRFALGVQFHPEWQYQLDPFYSELFRAFGDAIRVRL